jgi:hypothetical protein
MIESDVENLAGAESIFDPGSTEKLHGKVCNASSREIWSMIRKSFGREGA